MNVNNTDHTAFPEKKQVTDTVYKLSKYFSLANAAIILECDSEDLLHLGAIGKLKILSPVIPEGEYETEIGIPRLKISSTSYKRQFNFADRLFLSSHSLSKIEAQGWAV